ncbi:MAG: hypothetical protein ABIR80_18050, partial [Opitutaceae bacterium]
MKVVRNFTAPLFNGVSYIGEALTSETVGTSTGLAMSFDYYTDPSDFGSLGYLKSATMPGGGWTAYEYYPTNASQGFRGGRVKYKYRPYLSSPGTVSQTQGQGEITYHEYANDVFGAPTRPSLVETKINGILVAKTTTTYNDGYGPQYIASSTRTEYSSTTQSLQTQARFYRDDCGDTFLRGQTFSIVNPDATQQSFLYQRGIWDGSAFTSDTEGTASRVASVTGIAGNGSPTIYSVFGAGIEGLQGIESKSKLDVTIRDSRALVARTESHIWKNGAWQLVTFTNYTYDFAGRLVSRVSSNGATYTATYDGGLKVSETDQAGVTTTTTYDAANQVSVSTRTGSGTIGAVATHFAYDAAGHVIEEQVGWGQSEKIITSRVYDDAGRVTLETPPGNYGVTTHSYNPAARTHTVTRADGSTAISTDYLDGRPYSTTGTGVVPEYNTYGVETSGSVGQRWHRVDVGTSSSPRWKKSWVDLLGRTVKSEAPGFTGQANLLTENFYKVPYSAYPEAGAGYLIKTTSSGLTASTLYEYNSFGEVIRSGVDINNDGYLQSGVNDRYTETETTLESYSSAWWSRTDSRQITPAGLVTTSIARTRLTGHPANRLSESQSIDAEGNVTTQVVDVNRAARTSVATTTRSGIPTSMVENTLNGFSTSVTSFDGLTATTAYDALLRPNSVTNSRGNTTTTAYVSGTRMPLSVTDATGAVAVTNYNAVGGVNWSRDPKNFYSRFAYNLRGQVTRQWGDGTMPVEYGYDATYGERTTMSTYRGGTGWEGVTWPSSPGTADTTTWTSTRPRGFSRASAMRPRPSIPPAWPSLRRTTPVARP